MTAMATRTGAPSGAHQRCSENTWLGPIRSSPHARPMFDGLKMWRLLYRRMYFGSIDIRATRANNSTPRQVQ